MLTNLFYLLFFLAGFPTGILLAKMCSDETKNWRKRLLIISGISLLGLITILFTEFNYSFPTALSLVFIIIVNLTIIWKSY